MPNYDNAQVNYVSHLISSSSSSHHQTKQAGVIRIILGVSYLMLLLQAPRFEFES